MRKLVTIRIIDDIQPIEGADAIEVATIGGWKVVVKKGEYSVGEYVFYFEIDSVLPKGNPAFEFLMARSCKIQPTDDGGTLEGHRLRTIKLRGQISQGLILPLSVGGAHTYTLDVEDNTFITEGGVDELATMHSMDEDFSEIFGVKKYEPKMSAQQAGMVAGNFPSWFPKTDLERVQNMRMSDLVGKRYVMEEKVEGSSMSIFYDGETYGVTSRRLNLAMDQEGNTFVNVAKRPGYEDFLKTLYEIFQVPVAIQGELVGPGIQGNIYGLKDFEFFLFDIWVGDHYLNVVEKATILLDISARCLLENRAPPMRLVPVAGGINIEGDMTVDDIIQMADGYSELEGKTVETLREGLVFRSVDGSTRFKAISNEYLLKH